MKLGRVETETGGLDWQQRSVQRTKGLADGILVVRFELLPFADQGNPVQQSNGNGGDDRILIRKSNIKNSDCRSTKLCVLLEITPSCNTS